MSALRIVIDKLKSVAGVTAITTATRIYPGEAPQGALAPYLVINLVSENDHQMVSGAGKLYTSRVQINAVGANMLAASDLGEAVKAALQDVVKETIGSRTGVDIYKTDTDFTQVSESRLQISRILDFLVSWR